MKKMLDMEDFPLGTWVKTPTGKLGTVIKARGAESKHDHFQRVVVWFGGGARDTIVLQPHLLVKLDKHPSALECELKIV
ncbi:MAG: hypothetical protein ACRC7G_02445 [Beijerinckiaceae bacterium]